MRIFIISTLLFLITIPVQGQDTIELSLLAATEYAMKNNADIKSSALDVERARLEVMRVRAAGLPQINGKIEYSNFVISPTTLLPGELAGMPAGTYIPVSFTQPHNMDAGVNGSQLLFDGSFFYGLRAIGQYRDLVEKQLESKRVELKYQINSAYFGVLVLDENLRLINKNLENLSKIFEETSALYEAGFVEEIEVDRLKLSLDNLKVTKKKIVRQRENALEALKLLMGTGAEASVKLTDNLETLLASTNVDPDVQVNYDNRVDLQVVRTQKALQDVNIKVNKARFLPSMYAFASYNQNAQRQEFNFLDFDEDWYESMVVGVTLNVPIFTGRRNAATLQDAKIAYDQVELYEDFMENMIDFEVMNARNELRSAKEEFTQQQESIRLADKIYNVALIKYREGVGSSLELSSAEQQLYQTQSNYINAIYNYLNAKSQLLKALGQ